MQKLRVVVLVIGMVALLFFFTSGGFLVVDEPQHADAIVVLAGEANRRPQRALELLSQGYAPRMVLDVPAGVTIFNQTALDLARSYVQKLPQRDSIGICPIKGLSTKTESYDVQTCLSNSGVRSILLVTSDYHTRRARSTFQHTFRGDRISVAAATDPVQFGRDWWQNRQWAKFNFDEWLRLVWWQGVDRWR